MPPLLLRPNGAVSLAIPFRAVLALLLLTLFEPAHGAGIGVNFTGNPGGTPGTNIAPGISAGVVPQRNWNNMSDLAAQASPVPLLGDAGTASGAAITWSCNNTWSVPANATSQPLMDGYLDSNATNQTITATFTGIPFSEYEVYVYVGSDGNGRTGRTRVNGNAGSDIWHSTATNPFTSYLEGTATSEGAAISSNYARYTGLSGSNLTVETLRGSNNFGLHGIQIVEIIPNGAPTVDTLAAQNITSTAARLRGTLVATGTSPPTVRLYWGRTDGGTAVAAWQNVASIGNLATPQDFQADISGLTAGLTYYFRAYAANAQGEDWAPQTVPFATTVAAPMVENIVASDLGAFSAKTGALVTANGGEDPSVSIYYGTTDAGTNAAGWENSVPLGVLATGVAGNATLTGLAPGRPYFFRARATNGGGSTWAPSSLSFATTSLSLPGIVNEPADTITGVSARLNGRVTSTGGDPPSITFYYGPTDGGSVKANWSALVQIGTDSGAFSHTIGNLNPLSNYYFRALAANGAGEVWASPSLSFQTPAFVAPSIVINEIHYDESDRTSKSEFVELYNNSASAVDLSGWYFSSGVKSGPALPGGPSGDFTLPNGTTLPAGGYLVVAQDPATLFAKFGSAGALGPWFGKLSNSGEKITLRDAAGDVVDEVDYKLGFPWPTVGDPPDPSIELIDPNLDNNLGGNWRSSGNVASSAVAPANYIARDQIWSYRKGTSFPSVDGGGRPWIANGHVTADDGEWLSGQAPVGFGDNDDNTLLSDMTNNYITFFMRRQFTIAPGAVPPTLRLSLHYDDGVIVWINGIEVLRTPGMTTGAIPFPPPASFTTNHEVDKSAPAIYTPFDLTGSQAYLVEGVNTIAMQLINGSIASSDSSLDAELDTLGSTPGQTAAVPPSPGTLNSVLNSNAPPALRQVNHSPKQPASGQDVTVTVKATDPGGVSSVSLDYQIVEPGDYIEIGTPRYQTLWTTLPMHDAGTAGDALAGDGIFSAVIPAPVQTHRRLIRYRITAADDSSLAVTVPYADDPQPNFAYFVYDGIPAYTGKATPTAQDVTYDFNSLPPLQQNVPVYHLITTRADHVNAQYIPGATAGKYTGSEYLWQGTLVYDGKVYDHIRFRARGGVWRYAMGKNMWKFDFNRGHRLEARDNFGKRYATDWGKLNFSALIQQGNFNQRGEQGLFEGAGFKLHNLVGNAAPKTHYTHFRIIENADENGTAGNQFDTDFQGLYLAVEQMDGQFLEEHGLPDGNLYKMEGGTGELNNQGPDQPSNKSDLNAFLGAYTGANTQPESWWMDNVNVDDYYNFRAIATFIHDYDIAFGKNYFFLHNPATHKWEMKNWDLDLTWTTTYGGGGETDAWSADILAIPNFSRDRRNRMRELRDLLLNPEQTGMILDEVAQFAYTPGLPSYVDADRTLWDYNPILVSGNVDASKAGHGRFYEATGARTFSAMLAFEKAYIASRGSFIDSNILTDEAQVPATPTLTYTGLSGFPANGISASSSNFNSPSGSSFAAMEWRLASLTDVNDPLFDPAKPRKYEIEADWETGEIAPFANGISVPALVVRPGLTYRLRVRHKDSAGRWGHWSNPVQFVAGVPDVTGFQQNLMITEIMYNPPQPNTNEALVSLNNDDFEFIELKNIGATQLDLTDVRFTKGVDFDIAPGTALEAGAYALLVKNVAAFEARYGPGLPVLGTYGGDNLSNGGEQLKLSFGLGTAIHDLTYSDAAPWPTAADGMGASLVLIDPAAAPDHALAQNWRASYGHGSPGRDDILDYNAWSETNNVTGGPEDDDDDDGILNVLELYLLGNPNASDTEILPQADLRAIDVAGTVDNYLTLTFRYQPAAGFQSFLEFTDGLDDWDNIGAVFVLSTAHPDGTVTETWRSDLPQSLHERIFGRLRIVAPQP
jgi:hypothetical protein